MRIQGSEQKKGVEKAEFWCLPDLGDGQKVKSPKNPMYSSQISKWKKWNFKHFF